jgi:hypothetical protein
VTDQIEVGLPGAVAAEAAAPRRRRAWVRGRWLRHEWTLAAAGSVLLSVVMMWPAMRAPTPTDLAEDELIQFWSVDGFTDIANGSSGYIPPGL